MTTSVKVSRVVEKGRLPVLSGWGRPFDTKVVEVMVKGGGRGRRTRGLHSRCVVMRGAVARLPVSFTTDGAAAAAADASRASNAAVGGHVVQDCHCKDYGQGCQALLQLHGDAF